jgi:hypothetical protein
MSNAIISKGAGNFQVYGTEKAIFLLDEMDNPRKVNNLATFLWNEFENSQAREREGVYKHIHKSFSTGRPSRDRRSLENAKEIYEESGLHYEIEFGSGNIFLLSELFDIKKGLIINREEESYRQVFNSPSIIAGLRRVSNTDSMLVIEPHKKGVAFNPYFLYEAGKKFGHPLE